MKHWLRIMLLCAGGSMILHFLWNWLAFSVRGDDSMSQWKTLGAVAIMFTGMLIYSMLVVVGSDWSRCVFAPHSAKELWGWPLSLLSKKKPCDRAAACTDE